MVMPQCVQTCIQSYILGMARAIWMDEYGQFWSFSYHHYITTGYPGGREICDTGGQFVEYSGQRKGG